MSGWQELYERVRGCQLCALSQGRTLVVPGEGPETVKVLFIGEAPGYHEDKQGRPFVGAAGQFLQELLGRAGLRREQVYIANVIKCRPPNNRDPLPEELEACRPYIEQQIQLLQPKLIVTLGRFSMARYFSGQSISRIHGQYKQVGGLWVMPMFHPAAALHQPRYRSMIEEDFSKVPALLAEIERLTPERPPEPPAPPPKPEQLSFF